MAGNPPLHDPEQIGPNGYVWAHQFDLALPSIAAALPHIRIDSLQWLRRILSYFGVNEVDSETFKLPGSTAWQGRVDFAVSDLGHTGEPLELSVYGLKVSHDDLAEKYGFNAAIKLLAAVGFEFPTYFSMLMQAMDEEAPLNNVEHLCLTRAQNNTTHLTAETNMTYTGCSFEAILEQVMKKHGYTWEYAYLSPVLTTTGFQAKLIATKRGKNTGPSLIVVSKPCNRLAEATESVLCTTLTYISNTCGCRIGDLHYGQYMIKRFQREHPASSLHSLLRSFFSSLQNY